MPELIIFNCIAVNSINNSAAVFVGDSSASGWDASNKTTSSIRNVAGAGNLVTANMTLIIDSDVVDTPIVHSDITGPATQV